MSKKIYLIAAMSQNRVIGNDNQLPWHLPADLQHFKQLTTGYTIVMGRKTFESIGKALPNRQNIVISHQKFSADNIEVANSIEEALTLATHDIFIIGGAYLYEQTFPLVEKLFITLIETDIKGDRFFPVWDEDDWQLISESRHLADEKNLYTYRFLEYQRK